MATRLEAMDIDVFFLFLLFLSFLSILSFLFPIPALLPATVPLTLSEGYDQFSWPPPAPGLSPYNYDSYAAWLRSY